MLLPDPALSTGYGQDFIQGGWGAWGAAPYTDLMAITDAAEARDDIDETRTAAMGGSFGGYMANWVAGHTDRFRAIVTHASLWALDQFGPTTDARLLLGARDDRRDGARELPAPVRRARSSRRCSSCTATRTTACPSARVCASGTSCCPGAACPPTTRAKTPHRFLYFPDENHWVLSPQHAIVWYQVVEAFLAEHVLARTGENGPVYPEILG